MLRHLDVRPFLEASPGIPVLDVRSPGEFARGHIPGAHNLPLFDDAQRAVVGTCYKQQGRDAAVLEGLRLVGPRLAGIVEEARALAPDGAVRVHCWRGGERSGSVAWLLDKAGFTAVSTLKGGYKAFRHHVLQALEGPWSLRVLGGYTGSGKTAVLQYLREAGEPVIDLEALACHKGSSFGMLGEAPQPTTEQFENLLWAQAAALGLERPVWVEDESVMIGHVKLPQALFDAMRTAPLLFVEMPAEERVVRLVQDYGAFPREQLAEALVRIRRRMGPQHCKAALEALEQGDLHAVARTTLAYYDRAYQRSVADRAPGSVVRMPASAGDLAGLVQHLVHHVHDRR
ncbi:MAG: tRNA 2-selenouridine(34) synthase MnmH [Bacteroidetes bacterium]|nr:tRNA 2-selenouridine(34) synthase MnmH [Bacteroidota bacterium]